jgi:hypothetical protein
MAIATVNRTLQELRETRSMDFRHGKFSVNNWRDLCKFGGFDPSYLHLKKPPSEILSTGK